MALSKHKKAVNTFIETIDAMLPGGKNTEMYRKMFSKMNDKELEEWVKTNLVDKKQLMPFYYGNLGEERLDVENLFNICEKLGVQTYQRLITTDPDTGIRYKTPEVYLVLPQELRRQKQHLTHGISVSETSRFTDAMTGQVIGVSRSSGLSLPELYIMESKRHIAATKEFVKIRGGDTTALKEAKRSTVETGSYRLGPLEALGSVPTSTETLRSIWFAMLYEATI